MSGAKFHIALDGPLNGDYISPQAAEANDYVLAEWAQGEWAYLHYPNAENFDAEGVPLEIAQEIDNTLEAEA